MATKPPNRTTPGFDSDANGNPLKPRIPEKPKPPAGGGPPVYKPGAVGSDANDMQGNVNKYYQDLGVKMRNLYGSAYKGTEAPQSRVKGSTIDVFNRPDLSIGTTATAAGAKPTSSPYDSLMSGPFASNAERYKATMEEANKLRQEQIDRERRYNEENNRRIGEQLRGSPSSPTTPRRGGARPLGR